MVTELPETRRRPGTRGARTVYLSHHDPENLAFCRRWAAAGRGVPAPLCAGAPLLYAFCLMVLGGGCAIHHYDEKTGTEHVWGFGHMKMKLAEPKEGVRAVVGQVQTIGLGAGSVQESGFAVIGWQCVTRLLAIDADAAVRLEWPDSDLFNVRVGTQPPWLITDQPTPTEVDKE